MTLAEVVAKLEATYEEACTRLSEEMPWTSPELVRDVNGRYVLLDALTALAVAKAAL